MAADPLTVMLAYDGYCEELEDLERIVYGAQGIKLPPRTPAGKPSVKTVADTWRLFKAGHNARMAAEAGAKGRKTPPAPPET